MQLVLGLAVLLLGAAATTLVGGRLRRALRVEGLLPVERLLVDQAAGLAVVAFAGTLLGFAGAFHPPLLGGLLLAGLLADPRRLPRLPAELAAAARNLRPSGAGGWAAALAAGVLLLGSLAGALLPEAFFDVLIYQLGLPRQALLTGSLAIEPSMVQSAWPQSWGVLFASHLAAGGLVGAQLFAWWPLPLAAAGLVPFARRAGLRGGAAAALAVLVLVSIPGLLIASTTATIDHGLLFLATAALILLALYRRTGDRAALVLAALPVGTMVGSKYTALYVLVAATALIAARALRNRKALVDAAVFATLALALASPWYLRSLVVTGNPAYPAFSERFGGDGDALHAEQRLASERTSFRLSPRGAWRAFRSWMKGSIGLGWGAEPGWLLRLAPAALLLCLLPRRPWRQLRPWAGLFGVVWLLWFSLQPGARYLYPVYPIAALAIAALLAPALRSRWFLRAPLLLLIAAALVLNARQAAVTVSRIHGGLGSPAAVWSAVTDRDAHLARVLDHWSAADWLNREAPEDGRILLIGETRILYFERPLLYSSAYDRHVIQRLMEEHPDSEALVERLRAEGVTHVLVNWFEVERLGRCCSHLQLRPDENRILTGALDSMTRVFAHGRVEVRELPPAAPGE